MDTIRPRLNTSGASRIHRRQQVNEDNSFMIQTVRQLIVCCLIAGIIFTVSKINTPACKTIINSIDNTLVYTVDYKSASIGLWNYIKSLSELINKQNTQNNTPNEENADAQTN